MMTPSEPQWVARDVAELRAEFARGDITARELEDGLDDVYGLDGGIGHSRYCMIDLPSGSCTCGGWDEQRAAEYERMRAEQRAAFERQHDGPGGFIARLQWPWHTVYGTPAGAGSWGEPYKTRWRGFLR